MSEEIMVQEREFTLAEVAERLRISKQTARKRVEARLIRARKEGLEWRVKESDLEAYIESTYRDSPGEKEK